MANQFSNKKKKYIYLFTCPVDKKRFFFAIIAKQQTAVYSSLFNVEVHAGVGILTSPQVSN